MLLFFRYFSYFFISLLFLSRPFSAARTLPGPLTIISADTRNTTVDTHNATWHDFARFLDAGKGSLVVGMSELKKYFNRFGYLPNINFTDLFDSEFEKAVLSYQTNLGLPVNGKLDSTTISAVMAPRCGVPDKALHVTKHYAYFNGKPRWVKETPLKLTYSFSPENMIDYISSDDIKSVFKRAFARWASVIPVSFTEVEDYKSADIKIGWFSHDHGDGQPFDGVLGVLAHAFSPENGRFHLDEAETWTVDFEKVKSRVAVDLESVATHEIGHILGLAHSSVKGAVMYPSLSPRTKKVDLKIDDVEGVQALYGSNPNFKFSSLLESENSIDKGSGVKCRMSTWSIFWLVGYALLLVLCS